MRILLAMMIVFAGVVGCERPKTTGNNAFKEYVSVPKQKARDVKETLEGAQDDAARAAEEAMEEE